MYLITYISGKGYLAKMTAVSESDVQYVNIFHFKDVSNFLLS